MIAHMGLFSVRRAKSPAGAVLRVVWRGSFTAKRGKGGREGSFYRALIIDCDVYVDVNV